MVQSWGVSQMTLSPPGDLGRVRTHLWLSQLGHHGLEGWGPKMCLGRPQTATLPGASGAAGHGAGQGSQNVPHESLILSHPRVSAGVWSTALKGLVVPPGEHLPH